MAGRVVQLGCVAAFPWALCIVQGRGRYDILGQSILGQSTFDMGMDRTGFRNDLKKKCVNLCKYSTPIEFKLLVKIIHIPHVFCALLMNFRTTCIGRKVSSKSSCGRPFTTKKVFQVSHSNNFNKSFHLGTVLHTVLYTSVLAGGKAGLFCSHRKRT